MKRAGFTMIELIFVIVILGILAAVALPKFAGVSDQANAQKCAAFVGTLNRTVGPSMWSTSVADGSGGSIVGITYNGTGESNDTETYIAEADLPTECFGVGAAAGTLAKAKTFTTLGGLGTPTFGTSDYNLTFASDGTLSESPRWTWNKI